MLTCIVSFAVTSFLAAAPGDERLTPLSVVADFEGGSARDVSVDQATRTIRVTPGGDPARGWPCWWYFRIDGTVPGETLTVLLRGSPATVADPRSSLQKPLSPNWAMPSRASCSDDGQAWRHTEPGVRRDEWMVYTLKPSASSIYVAWGPPYTPTAAAKLVRQMSEKSPHARALELCRSRGDRAVPMLSVREGDRPDEQRFGIWVQARQHAWESGSTWVAHGFTEWLMGDSDEAAWLRQHAEVFIVPIMDVDNAATGNGGKDALPHDHNRDWSDEPHWNETKSAQQRVGNLIDAGRMDVFLDLHNPAAGDPTFFYILPDDLLPESARSLRNRFMQLAHERISQIQPQIPTSNKPKVSGPGYHPLWRQISANWVAIHGNSQTVSLCLETVWNSPQSTTDGYRAVGARLGAAVAAFLKERSAESARSLGSIPGT